MDLATIRAGVVDFSNKDRPKTIDDLITALKKLSNYADLNINETKLKSLETKFKALFDQPNRDFNANLLDKTKPYIEGRLTRQMSTLLLTVQDAIKGFDTSTIKKDPTLALELELDIIIGGLLAVYQDFKTKIDNVSNRLESAAQDLDFLIIRRINGELQ